MTDRHGHCRTAIPARSPGSGLMRVAGWVLLLPFLLFSLIAQGTMLVPGSDNSPVMTLCSPDGLMQVLMTADGQLRPADQGPAGDPHADQPCDWAVHAQSMLEGLPPTSAPLHLVPQLARFMPPAPVARPGINRLAQPARGPPQII